MTATRTGPERRGFYRVLTRISPRSAAWFDEARVAVQPLDALVLDISGGGMLLHTRDRLPVGAQLEAVFTLEGDPQPLDVRAVAVDVHSSPPGSGRLSSHAFRVHAMFVDLTRTDAERIVRYVFRQQMALRRRGLL